MNGKVITNEATQVHESNKVAWNEQTLKARGFRYILMHKPANTICSNVDEVYPSVFNYLPVEKLSELHIAGRLDADTTGLVLITDDGRWSHNVISPKKECQKIYRVWLRTPITVEKSIALIEQFSQGIQLQGESSLTKPAILTLVTDTDVDNEVLLTITEGRYHQVKRMIAAISNRVEGLKRIQIGELKLPDDLEVGDWRWLTASDMAKLGVV